MISRIMSLACLPKEWIKFLHFDNYKISEGDYIMEKACHSDMRNVSKSLRMITYLSSGMYEELCYSYDDVKVQMDTAEHCKPILSPRIWEPSRTLCKRFDKLDTTTFPERAVACNALWKDIVDITP
jgi:hypothetical protein